MKSIEIAHQYNRAKGMKQISKIVNKIKPEYIDESIKIYESLRRRSASEEDKLKYTRLIDELKLKKQQYQSAQPSTNKSI